MTRNAFFSCLILLLCATAFHGQKRHFSDDIRIEPLVNNGVIQVLRVKLRLPLSTVPEKYGLFRKMFWWTAHHCHSRSGKLPDHLILLLTGTHL